jgi:transcriptional antiterminator RfaH
MDQGYHVFRPLAHLRRRKNGRIVERTESLFPRYLFIQLTPGADNWLPIHSTRGVTGILRFGEEPTPVPDGVIDDLQARITGPDGSIDLRPFQQLRRNQTVRIESGPFAGYEALFQATRGEDRVLVLLEFMQRNQQITVPAADIKPTDTTT